jgi:DNA-binding beta-propeller fold protein YncE
VVTLGDEGPVAATAVPGVVWIVDATAGVGTLSRIDPAAGRVDLRIELAEEPTAVAADADRVLVTDADRRLQAYSARTGARLDWSQRFGINLNDDVVIGAGAAWYIDSDRVSRASLADPSESSTTGLEGDAVALAFGEGAVWAAVWEGEGRGSVVRLDPATGEVTRTVRMPGRADDVAAGAGAVWAITCCEDPRLARIDP